LGNSFVVLAVDRLSGFRKVDSRRQTAEKQIRGNEFFSWERLRERGEKKDCTGEREKQRPRAATVVAAISVEEEAEREVKS
jgi:hypothetical protein